MPSALLIFLMVITYLVVVVAMAANHLVAVGTPAGRQQKWHKRNEGLFWTWIGALGAEIVFLWFAFARWFHGGHDKHVLLRTVGIGALLLIIELIVLIQIRVDGNVSPRRLPQ